MEPTPERLRRVSAKLFAKQGLAGTSMREIARETGITQAAIYHHFPCKEDLYMDAVRTLHREKMQGLSDVVELQAPPAEKLHHLVLRMLELMEADPDFRHIYYRELMEGDEERLRELADSVFSDVFAVLRPLMTEIAPHLDPMLTLMSLSGLVLHHLEVARLIPLLPGGSEAQTRLPVLAEHITTLVLNGVRPC
jgi:AcrR family transcriptional regulator